MGIVAGYGYVWVVLALGCVEYCLNCILYINFVKVNTVHDPSLRTTCQYMLELSLQCPSCIVEFAACANVLNMLVMHKGMDEASALVCLVLERVSRVCQFVVCREFASAMCSMSLNMLVVHGHG